jgi:pSer/pThr/pTyr-binding forkhead associated (FHA) protein
MYLYDLRSTYGTCVNRKRVEPESYIELFPGMQVKFGNSARMYIVTGGPVEEPAEEPKKAEPTADEPKLSKRQQKKLKEEMFSGTAEEVEKFVRQAEHKKRQNQRHQEQKKKQKKQKTGIEDDDDEEPMEENSDEIGSDDVQNVGEADPDRVVVGGAR